MGIIASYIVLIAIFFFSISCKVKKSSNKIPSKQKESIEANIEKQQFASLKEREPIEEIQFKKKERLLPSEISISNVRLVEYSLLGKDGGFYAPAIIFDLNSKNPDYYTFELCDVKDSNNCFSGKFGEEGEALCGVPAGEYTASIKACIESIGEEIGGCTKSLKAIAPFTLKESSSSALKKNIAKQCEIRSAIKERSKTLYQQLKQAKKAKALKEDTAHKNCSAIKSQLEDWGPDTFAHRVSFYGKKFEEIAQNQYELFQKNIDIKNNSLNLANHSSLTKEDCISINYKNSMISDQGGNYKIVADKHYLYDFGRDLEAAQKVLLLLKENKITSACYVGRPNSIMNYHLSNGKPMNTKTKCATFDSNKIYIKYDRDHWFVGEQNTRLIQSKNKSEVEQAYSIIKKYKFDNICLIGVGQKDAFSYFSASRPFSDQLRGKGHPIAEKIAFFNGVMFVASAVLLAYGSVASFLSLQKNPYRVTEYINEGGELKKSKVDSIDRTKWKALNEPFKLISSSEKKKLNHLEAIADGDFLKGTHNSKQSFKQSVGRKWLNQREITVYEGNTKKVYTGIENSGLKKAASIGGIGASIGLAVFGVWWAGGIQLADTQKACLSEPNIETTVQDIQNLIDKSEQNKKEADDLLTQSNL